MHAKAYLAEVQSGEAGEGGHHPIRISRTSVVRLLVSVLSIAVITTLAAIAALRRDTYDTAIYRDYFQHCHQSDRQWAFYDDQNFELGFQLLTRAIAAATDDPREYFFVLTFAGLACTLRAARIFGAGPLAVLLYFAASLYPLLFLVQMRQGLANSIGFLGLAFYTRGRGLRAAILLLLAATIHVSALLLLMMLICDWMWRRSRTTMGVWIIVVITTIYLGRTMLYSLSWGRVVYYLDNPEFNQAADVLRISTLKYLGLAVAAACLLRKRMEEPVRLLVITCAAAVVMRVVFADNAAFSGRLGASLTFCEIFLVPWLLRRLGREFLWIGLPLVSVVSAYYLLFIEHPEILILY